MFYYKQIKDGEIASVEAKSNDATSPGFVMTTKAEYDSFVKSLPIIIPEPVRNLAAEIDGLKARLEKLEG